jgi:hypothetical protein
MAASGSCGNTGNLATSGTLPAVCIQFKGSVPAHWAASNTTAACSITVTGGGTTQMVTGAAAANPQPPMAAGADGYVYWNLTAGCVNYSAIYCY